MTPEIAQAAVHLRSDASAMLTEASVVIARFDADFGDVPAIPEVLRQVEAAASSQIEHLTAPAQAVAEARLTGAGSSAAAGIAANDRALAVAIARAGRLDGDAILATHRELLAGSVPAIAGQWRTDQAWIGGSSLGPQHAIFVPPHQDRVAPAMQDLIDFMARADISPLIQAIIAHAQFETIHPFPDGNGRTGRAVMHSLLQAKGLTRQLSVPISVGLAVDTGAYFEALGAYRRGELEPIVTVMCRAVHYSIARSRTMIAELIALRASWDEKITARSHATVWKITGLLLTQPCLDSALLERELVVSNTNALIALKNLEDAGVLTGVSAHRRGRIWRAVAVLRCLERFAEPSPRSF